jgi:hypothetical protein
MNGARASVALAMACTLCAVPAHGRQASQPQEVEASEEDGDEATDRLHLPGYESRAGKWSLELGIAPELVSHNPLRRGTETSNAMDLSLILATVQPLSHALEAEFDVGAVKTIDNGSFSTWAAAAELRTRPDAAGFALFYNYAFAQDYDDWFGQRQATTHTVTSGLRFGRALGNTQVGFELAPRWKDSSVDDDDQVAVNLQAEVVTPLVEDKVYLILDASAERRWYRNRDPVLAIKRRDWRFATYAGLDLAGLFGVRDRWLHDLSAGVEWLKVDSNIADQDRSDLALMPVVSIGVSF